MKNCQKRTTYDKILEVVVIAVLLWAFCPLLFYNSIDSNAVFPTHYNIAGEVDGWGGRSFLWILPLIGLALYIGLSIAQKYPRILNYPRQVTEQNADYLHKMGVQLIRHIKVIFVFILAYGCNDMYAGAMGKAFSHSGFVVILSIAGMFLIITIFCIKMIRYNPSKK